MKLHLSGMLLTTWLAAVSLALGAAPDTARPAVPAKPPAPRWFKAIDQGDSDASLKGYLTPTGVKLEVVADFPVVANPVGMTFATDGSLYVLEWRPDPKGAVQETLTITYKDGTKRTVPVMKKSVKDVIKVLRDTKGKGVYDQAQVILEEELPSSILVNDGWLYVSGRGSVRRYQLADLKDGAAKQPKAEVILQGFGGVGHHQVSGLTLGHGGWLNVTVGAGDHVVEGSDGSRASVLGTGAIFRCRPDGSRLAVHALGFRNPYRDVAFDAAFNLFHIDNRGGTGGCRLIHAAEAGDYGIRPPAPVPVAGAEDPKGAASAALPGKLPPMLDLGHAAAAGICCYNESRFPDHYYGLIHVPDVFNQRVATFRLQRRGSTFEVGDGFDLLKSSDNLFRPCQVTTGPDGALYVCDWRTDSTGSGKFAGDGKHGRLYRLRWAGTDDHAELPLRGIDSWAKIPKLSDEGLLKAMGSEELSERLAAGLEAVRRGGRLKPALLRMVVWPHLEDKELAEGPGKDLVKEEPLSTARVTALGALESLWDDGVRDAFLRVLRDPEVTVRRLAVEAIGRNSKLGDRVATEALVQNLEAADPTIRRAIYLALGRVGGADAADALVNSFKFDDGKDVVLSDGLLRAIERTGKSGIDKLVALAESGDESDHDRTLEAFLALRTRPAAEAIPGLLKYPHLTIRQRADLLRSFGNYRLEPAIALEPVLDYLVAHADAPAPVKLAGLDVLAASPLLRNERGQKVLLAMFDENEPLVRRHAIPVLGSQAAGARLAAELFLAKKLPGDLQPQVLEALRKYVDGDKEAARLHGEVMKVK